MKDASVNRDALRTYRNDRIDKVIHLAMSINILDKERERNLFQGAHGVVVSHPLRMRKAHVHGVLGRRVVLRLIHCWCDTIQFI